MMTNIVLDAYVVFWKHFDRQKSKDQDFLARATCSLCVGILMLNIAQVFALVERVNLGVFHISSKLGEFIFVGIGLTIGARGIKLIIEKHPELLQPDGISRRYDRVSTSRAVGIAGSAFANLIVLLVLQRVRAA